jgi:hypothetical protein
MLTPCDGSPRNTEAAIAVATAIRGVGAFGSNFSKAMMTANVPSATSSVAIDVAGRCRTISTTSRKKPSLWILMPSSFGIWSTTTTNPMPALNPVSTGSEMKFARKPRRKTRATRRIAPTRTASVAVAAARLTSGWDWVAAPSAAAPRIAIVVVELTLSTGEVPRSA